MDLILMNVIEIDDLNAPGLELFAHLTEPQLRHRQEPEMGIFIAESLKVIELALKEGCQPVAFLMERKRLHGPAGTMAAAYAVPVYTGDREVLAGLIGYTLTRGILCALRRPVLPPMAELVRTAHRVAVLDGITDAMNVGAIFRSAAALAIDAVLLTPSCCDPLCRRSVRVSMGTIFQEPWARMGADVRELNRYGFKTAAMALRPGAVSIDDAALAAEQRLALVFGTEGTGLPAGTIDACDYVVTIPMANHVDSLNVAAASAVAFWQLRFKD